MPANTEALDDGKYVTMSSLSVVASRATVRTTDLVVAGNQTLTGTLSITSNLSVGGTTTLQGAARANSVLTAAGWLYGGVFISSATTAQSGATSKVSQQGQLYFSVLSLDTNGGEFGFRSGNTVYRFVSDLVG